MIYAVRSKYTGRLYEGRTSGEIMEAWHRMQIDDERYIKEHPEKLENKTEKDN